MVIQFAVLFPLCQNHVLFKHFSLIPVSFPYILWGDVPVGHERNDRILMWVHIETSCIRMLKQCDTLAVNAVKLLCFASRMTVNRWNMISVTNRVSSWRDFSSIASFAVAAIFAFSESSLSWASSCWTSVPSRATHSSTSLTSWPFSGSLCFRVLQSLQKNGCILDNRAQFVVFCTCRKFINVTRSTRICHLRSDNIQILKFDINVICWE